MPELLKIDIRTEPAKLPLDLNQAKQHLRLEDDFTSDDALIMGMIRASVKACEDFTSRTLITTALTLWLDGWPADRSREPWWDGVREGARSMLNASAREVKLPRSPLISVDLINTYDDSDVATVYATTNYFVDTSGGRVVLRNSASVPAPTRVANGIEIQFTTGYGVDPARVPQPLVEGIGRAVAHMYENRGDDAKTAAAKSGATMLWQPFRTNLL